MPTIIDRNRRWSDWMQQREEMATRSAEWKSKQFERDRRDREEDLAVLRSIECERIAFQQEVRSWFLDHWRSLVAIAFVLTVAAMAWMQGWLR